MKVEGLGELRKKLADLDAKIQTKSARRAVRAAGKEIQDEIRKNVRSLELAPSARKTLARSVFLKASARRGRLAVSVRIRKPDRRTEEKRDAYYWRWVEFGTANRYRQVRRTRTNRQKGSTEKAYAYTGLIRPQPFVRPALKSAHDRALAALEAELRRATDEAWRG